MNNIIVEFRDDADSFKQELVKFGTNYEQMPTFSFLISRIGKESYTEGEMIDNYMYTNSWTWFFDGEDNTLSTADTFTFVFNKKYEKEALEFKMRFG